MSERADRRIGSAAETRATFAHAHALHQRGELIEARALYEAVLAAQPLHFDCVHMLGVIALQSGDVQRAFELIGEAIEIRPDLAAPHVNLAAVHRALGRPDAALVSYNRAIRLHPDHVGAYHDRGKLLLFLDRPAEALASFDEAIALRPDHAEARLERGNALSRLDHVEEALDAYDSAIALRPEFAAAHYNRGNALRRLGRLDEAVAGYSRALALAPDSAEAHNNRGNALFDLRRLEEALADYDRAVALKPAFAEAFNNRGNLLCDLDRPGDALLSYARAIALRPDYPEAHLNRGNALLLLGRPGEAGTGFERALALQPERDFLPGIVLHARFKAAQWEGLEQAIEDIRSGILAGERTILPFAAALLFDDPDIHLRAARLYAEAMFPVAPPIARWPGQRAAGRIRVGYYSADFHDHATARLIAELFERHDRDTFEFVAFSFGPDRQDAMAERLRAGSVRFAEVGEKSDREIALLSREMGIDIAVDLKGYTEGARPGIFAARCAPVQLGWLGFPGTMGSDAFDYVIADRIVAPPGSQAHFTEKLIWLPGSYQPNDGRRAIADRAFTRAELGLPEKGFVFCCFNNVQKLRPAMFDRWMRILKAVDGSRLWLYSDAAEVIANLRREAEMRGVGGERLIFAERMPAPDHLARHRLAGLCLDSWPYNAHTTASDALWAGLPVLTCAGRSFPARVAASLLRAVGLPELIARNERDYEKMAIELATRPAKLAKLSARLERNRETAALFDATAFARKIERAFTAIHERHRAGLAPDLIDLTGPL